MLQERTSFLTDDNVTIVGNYEAVDDGPTALFLHMMPATKESWRPLAAELAAAGWSWLAIDFRGHGDSVMKDGVKINYKEFEPDEHQEKRRDVEAALLWLTEVRGARPGRIAIVGASIGANLAIAAAADHPEVAAVVALSPGLDYRGVTTEDKVSRLAPNQALCLVASDDDPYSLDTVRALAEKKPGATLRELSGAGHGTTMFDRKPDFLKEAAAWLVGTVR